MPKSPRTLSNPTRPLKMDYCPKTIVLDLETLVKFKSLDKQMILMNSQKEGASFTLRAVLESIRSKFEQFIIPGNPFLAELSPCLQEALSLDSRFIFKNRWLYGLNRILEPTIHVNKADTVTFSSSVRKSANLCECFMTKTLSYSENTHIVVDQCVNHFLTHGLGYSANGFLSLREFKQGIMSFLDRNRDTLEDPEDKGILHVSKISFMEAIYECKTIHVDQLFYCFNRVHPYVKGMDTLVLPL